MPTSNLNSQSLNGVLVESGTGTPDHVSPAGSYYTNTSTSTIFINKTGLSNGWEPLNKVSWGDMYLVGNTTDTVGTTSWVSLTGLTWTYYGGNGIDMSSNGVLRVKTGKGGLYHLLLTGTVQVQSSTASYNLFLGASLNNATPVNGFWSYATCDGNLTATASEEDDKTISVSNYIRLVPNDNIRMSMKMSSAATNARLESGTITLYRVSD